MPIQTQSDRQRVLSAQVEINFNDLVSGVAGNAIKLPNNAVVVGCGVHVLMPFNSATSDTLSIGDAALPTRHISAVNIKSAGAGFIGTRSGKRTTQPEWLTATWTGAGAAPTAGKVLVTVEYVISGAGDGNQD